MEEALQFYCENKRLYGILHLPETVTEPGAIVLVLTGGPQVRTGAHRLYVDLSRYLAARGVATFRFDYAGLGDSEGDFVGYSQAGPSISSAISFLQEKFHPEVRIFIWSLCDGSTASMVYASRKQEDVQGLILCNPYIMSEDDLARATVKYYYVKRFFDKAFWQKFFSLKVNLVQSLKSLSASLHDAGIFHREKGSQTAPLSVSQLFCSALQQYPKPVRIILSSDDIVAAAFMDLMKKEYMASKRDVVDKLGTSVVKGANHTFTEPDSKQELFRLTVTFLEEFDVAAPLHG